MGFPRLKLRRRRRGLRSHPSNQNGNNEQNEDLSNFAGQQRHSTASTVPSQMTNAIDFLQTKPPAPAPPDSIIPPPAPDTQGGVSVNRPPPPIPDPPVTEGKDLQLEEESGLTQGGYADMASIPIQPRKTQGSSKSSQHTTMLDRASRFRRMLRERFSGTRTSGASSTTLDDIPEGPDDVLEHFSDADASIVKYATDMHQAAEVDSTNSIAHSDSGLTSSIPSLIPRMPSEIPALQLCNDGQIEFLVPVGWVATCSMDSFCLSNGRSLGFVRAVPASNAAEALLETDRLQVMSHVYALSSPTFTDGSMTVTYSSNRGAGKGVAIFSKEVGDSAAVIAMCGPMDEQIMIAKSIEDLKKTTKVLKAPVLATGSQTVPCDAIPRVTKEYGLRTGQSGEVHADTPLQSDESAACSIQ